MLDCENLAMLDRIFAVEYLFGSAKEGRFMSSSLTFMCGPSAHNDWIKGSIDGWEWSTQGAGYEGERDFFSMHWQIDTPKGFFVNWQVDTPKDRPRVAPVDVKMHVASPAHHVDPALNDLKHEVIEALLSSSIEQQVSAQGFEYRTGPMTSVDMVQRNRTTQAFRVRMNSIQTKPTYKEDIVVVHIALGEGVDQVLRGFAARLRERFGP